MLVYWSVEHQPKPPMLHAKQDALYKSHVCFSLRECFHTSYVLLGAVGGWCHNFSEPKRQLRLDMFPKMVKFFCQKDLCKQWSSLKRNALMMMMMMMLLMMMMMMMMMITLMTLRMTRLVHPLLFPPDVSPSHDCPAHHLFFFTQGDDASVDMKKWVNQGV